MSTGVVLFTRDLRAHDHPALSSAVAECAHVVPLFVVDDRLLGSANRTAFLLDALADLRERLGGALVVRRGDPASAVAELRPSVVHVTEDWSRYARSRERRLRAVAEVRVLPGHAVVEPGGVVPSGGDHYKVFTPFWRAWRAAERRPLVEPPGAIPLPRGVPIGGIPSLSDLVRRAPSPDLPTGGESAGRERLERFLDAGIARYAEVRDALDLDATSRLSPYLRLGCVSALALAERAAAAAGGEELIRQLCWRDFCLQLLAAFPRLPLDDYRARDRVWRADEDALNAWRAGQTGVPIVDAGMRQLLREGWMPNRVRMLAASLLTKSLGIDWRLGAEHFFDLLVDGDPASNAANWQWVAGTGTDTRPNRVFNPVRQAHRFDPAGSYVRRHVPELASLDAPIVHEPWRLGAHALERLGYPRPIVELDAAARLIVPA